jgi:hypothetical protein
MLILGGLSGKSWGIIYKCMFSLRKTRGNPVQIEFEVEVENHENML